MAAQETPRLTEATVQEIQLELIRRSQHNAFDGEQVFQGLLEHRDWWEAVLLDNHPVMQLIKLRDLPENIWNTDTLYVLATNEQNARRLAEMGEEWAAEAVTYSRDETEHKLGTGGLEHQRLVTFWWD